MLLQNLHCRYVYILIKLPNLLDLEQQIPDFPNCDNYGSLTASNPDPMTHQQTIMNCTKLFVTINIIKLSNRLEHKINYMLPALLPNKLNITR